MLAILSHGIPGIAKIEDRGIGSQRGKEAIEIKLDNFGGE
jgi:hypothetical protein